MPRIIINEIDNTTAGLNAYGNFSVVVPGIKGDDQTISVHLDKTADEIYQAEETFRTEGLYKCSDQCVYYLNISPRYITLIFDENGVYECSNQKDFVKYVGKASGRAKEVSIPAVEAENATLLNKGALGDLGLGLAGSYSGAATEGKDGQTTSTAYVYADYVFTNKVADSTNYLRGRDFHKINNSENYTVYSVETAADDTPVKGENLVYLATTKTTLPAEGEPVQTVTAAKYKLTKATTWEDNKDYVVVSNAGTDGKTGETVVDYYNGNQIAYELLGLGYTVLYKLFDATTEASVEVLKTPGFWSCLKDKSVYDFRYLTTGGYFNVDAYKQICAVATAQNIKLENLDNPSDPGRGDVIALLDIPETGLTASSFASDVTDIVNDWASNTIGSVLNKFAEICAPQVIYEMDADAVYKNKTFPASFHYLACAAYAKERGYSEWYANAGYTRGISERKVTGTTIKVGEIAVNALQPRVALIGGPQRAVNLVIKDRNGYFFWGNRTAHPLNEEGLVASHFLNIRQLCCTLKKDLYVACRSFTFDPNSDILWINFCNRIRPILDRMKADQGIEDYKIIKVKTTKKAVLAAKIRIVPIEAVEDFVLNLFLEDSVSGTVVALDEEE